MASSAMPEFLRDCLTLAESAQSNPLTLRNELIHFGLLLNTLLKPEAQTWVRTTASGAKLLDHVTDRINDFMTSGVQLPQVFTELLGQFIYTYYPDDEN